MVKVFMYTLSTCPWCKKTKQWFKDHDVHFEYIDFDLLDNEARRPHRDRIQKDGLKLSFPIVYIDEEHVQGYNPDMYEKLLQKK